MGARSQAAWWPRKVEGHTLEAAGVRVGVRSSPGLRLRYKLVQLDDIRMKTSTSVYIYLFTVSNAAVFKLQGVGEMENNKNYIKF